MACSAGNWRSFPCRITCITLCPSGSPTEPRPIRLAAALCRPSPASRWQPMHAPSKTRRPPAFAAVAERVHEIAPTIPFVAASRNLGQGFAVEEQRLPEAHDSPLIERKTQIALRDLLPPRRERLQVGPQGDGIWLTHFRVRRV